MNFIQYYNLNSFSILIWALFPLTFGLLFSCTSKPTSFPVADSSENKIDSTEILVPYQLQPEDKIQIDYVQYLKETDEYAFPLKWKKGADIKLWYVSIAYDLKEVIYAVDYEYRRIVIPDSLIPQFFDVNDLKNVKLYDRENEYIGTGEFHRYEFIDQNVDPIPVAVYKLKKKNKDALYAVAGLAEVLPAIPSVEAPEERLKQLIEFKLPKDYENDYSLRNGFLEKQFYSIQGYREKDFSTFSVLYLEENGKLLKVNENIDFWSYCDLHPIPIYNQQQPLLLCNLCKSDTDWFQTSVLIFEDGKYVDLLNR